MGEKCGECPEPAVIRYGFTEAEERYACRAHDPLRPPFGVTLQMGWGFHYQALPGLLTTGVSVSSA
jgi:hypothetical protein